MSNELKELYRDLLIDELVKDYYLTHDSDKQPNPALKEFTKNYLRGLLEQEDYILANNPFPSHNKDLPTKNRINLILNINLNLIKNLKLFEMIGFVYSNDSNGTLKYLDKEDNKLELKDCEFEVKAQRITTEMSIVSYDNKTNPIDQLYKELDPKLLSVMKNTLNDEQLNVIAEQMSNQDTSNPMDKRISTWNNSILEEWSRGFVLNLNKNITVKETSNSIINTIDSCITEYKTELLTMKSHNIWIIINGSETFDKFKKEAKNAFSLSKSRDDSYLSYKGLLNGNIKVYYIDDSTYDSNLYIGNKTSNVNCGMILVANNLITLSPVVVSPKTYESTVCGICRFNFIPHPKIDLFHKSFKLV